jgi:RecG-like helicase
MLIGVGPASVERGLVKANNDQTKIIIRDVNTGMKIEEIVQTPGGEVSYDGDFKIDGVPNKVLRNGIKQALERIPELKDIIPDKDRNKFSLYTRLDSYQKIHFPQHNLLQGQKVFHILNLLENQLFRFPQVLIFYLSLHLKFPQGRFSESTFRNSHSKARMLSLFLS